MRFLVYLFLSMNIISIQMFPKIKNSKFLNEKFVIMAKKY